MVHYICGNIKDIQAQYNIGTYVDIVEYINKPIGLFDTNNNDTVYFIYNPKELKDKEDCVLLEHKTKDKEIYCIIENIDKKTSVYKYIKSKMIDMSRNILSVKDKASIFYDDISIIKEIGDNEIVSFMYALYYNYQNRKYKNISGKLINMVLTGKITSRIAKKLLLYFITIK